jgi:hypothetical protein
MKQKEGGQKLRNFLPGQVFLSHDKEPVEIKQSRSNGCLGGSEMSALKKHISLEKIIQSIPMKSRSKISLKESFKKAGKVSAKEGNGESLPESRIRIGLASYNESQKEVTSPLTPSRALPLKTDHGILF